MDEATEKAAELEAQKEVKVEEIRTAVIAEFGFDEVDDAEKIDKLVTKEVESRKKLSEAIGQKIKHRTAAETYKNDPRLKDAPLPAPKPVEVDIDKALDERLAKRDLDDMDVSDEIKTAIGDWAKFKGISVKQAVAAPHIATQIAEWKKEQAAEEATINRTHRGGSKTEFTRGVPPKVDFATPEGIKKYDEWKKWEREQGG